ncbi:hypothetical protein [Achromobacter sp. NCFB-sbj8-Ac1-l]|uniref:hypothetical protein n=1 Tax=unclassified Achromobacter TaxID=2626865 RepID=UPI004046F7A1
MHHDDAPEAGAVGSGYAAAMLAKAFLTHETHADPDVRERAAERVLRWRQVLEQALAGTVDYGSRTPLAGIPDWVTLEVVTGGFATGALLAGGPLTEFERELAARTPGIRAGHERRDLNAYFLGETGIAQLQARLADGDYHVDLPEEAALLTVAWLLRQGQAQAARDLVAVLAPFFDRLRFYPAPWAGDEPAASDLHVRTAGEVASLLAALAPPSRLQAQRATVNELLPRHDRAVALFLETVQDDWPCRQYPEGWAERAAALVREVEAAQAAAGQPLGGVSRRHRHKRELFDLLAQCVRAAETLTGRQVGRVRRLVQDYVAAHGAPDGQAVQDLRTRQRGDVAAPGFDAAARVVATRLRDYPEQAGVPDLTPVLAPLAAAEARDAGLPAGLAVPAPVARRVRRCQSGTLPQLVERGLIRSGEFLATLTPQVTASQQGAGFADPALRTLVEAAYRAFRRRRSLLLLNLARQAAFGDLPWIAAVQAQRQPAQQDADAAGTALTEIAGLAVTAFPHAALPNKLLQELRALSERAGRDLPWGEELAADIFMGAFGPKFVEAARCAASLLDGSLYARYYALEVPAILALSPARGEAAFVRLCAARAGVAPGFGQVGANGMVIEQQQILTTHNLALLVAGAGLGPALSERYGQLAFAAFEWLCARQQMKIDVWHARIRMLRNTAIAWRQAVFFLSLAAPAERDETIAAMQAHLAAQGAAFQALFRPVMRGLQQAARGATLPQHEAGEQGARVFLGWFASRHWMLDAAA